MATPPVPPTPPSPNLQDDIPVEILTEIASYLENPRDVFAFTNACRSLHLVNPNHNPVVRDFMRLLRIYEHFVQHADPLNDIDVQMQRTMLAALQPSVNGYPQNVQNRLNAATQFWGQRRATARIAQHTADRKARDPWR
jgi:hypothetical protein